MALNPDFRDLFASLNGAGAEYLVIGAYALTDIEALHRMET